MVHEPTPQSVTFLVAANDAAATSKKNADFLCDGTDDDVQIQAAINALPSQGGIVQLSEGIFNIGATININVQGVWFRGSGVRATVIFLQAGVNERMIRMNAGVALNGLKISDFEMDGNGANQTDGASRLVHCPLYFDGAANEPWNHVEICNLNIHDGLAGANFRLARGQYWYIHDCTSRDNGTHGVTAFLGDHMWLGEITDFCISNFIGEDCTDFGLAIDENCRRGTITNVSMQNCDQAGFGFGNEARFITFSNFSMDNCLDGCNIDTFGGVAPHDILLSNGFFTNCTDGIDIANCDSVTLSLCQFEGNTNNINEGAAVTNFVRVLNVGLVQEEQNFSIDSNSQAILFRTGIPEMNLFNTTATPATGTVLGNYDFQGKDSAGNVEVYARIQADVRDDTSTTEDGRMLLGVVDNGVFTNYIDLRGDIATLDIFKTLNLNGQNIILDADGDLLIDTSNDDLFKITIADDTQDAGFEIRNTDGSITLRNEIATASQFFPTISLNSAGSANFARIQSQIPIADDTGTIPCIELKALQNDATDITTRPILRIVNRLTKLWEIAADGTIDSQGNNLTNIGMLNLNDATRLLIASDIITVTQSFHTVDGAGATDDDLVTINGGTAGDKITLKPDDDAVTITIVDTGNIILAGDADFVMSDIADTWEAIFDGTNWLETSRSSNHV